MKAQAERPGLSFLIGILSHADPCLVPASRAGTPLIDHRQKVVCINEAVIVGIAGAMRKTRNARLAPVKKHGQQVRRVHDAVIAR